ncbi:hypothetical protein Droror1_Dr00017812 [Drosera rotundifolia]
MHIWNTVLRPTTNTKDVGIHGTPAGSRPTSSTQHAQETPHELNAVAIEEEIPEYSIPASINVGSRGNLVESERRDKYVGACPLGRKTTKELRHAKRQMSSEAQSANGEKVTKKLVELQTASSVGLQRATELHEEEVRCSIHAKRLQIIKDKMTFEKEMIIAEKQLYEFDGSVFGSPSDIYKVVAARKSRLAALLAEYDTFIEGELNSAPSISIGVPLQSSPSTSSFDEEANV